MVPWLTEVEAKDKPNFSTLNMTSRSMNMTKTGEGTRPQRLLSSEKYNSIKERLASGGKLGTGSNSSVSGSGHTKSSSSGEQFQRMTDIIHPPPGHPFLQSRPTPSTPYSSPPPSINSTPFSSYTTPSPHGVYAPTVGATARPDNFTVPPPTHHSYQQLAPSKFSPSQFPPPQPVSQNSSTEPRKSSISLLSGLMNMPSAQKELTTSDILSLVLRLSSVRVPSEAKKSGLLQLLNVPKVTESLVHQILTMENGDLFGGLKCVLARYMEDETEELAEIVELTLSFINKCLVLQKASPKLRSLIVGKSRELAVSSGGMSTLEQLVMVSKTRGSNTAKVNTTVCEEITEELRNVQPGRLLGTCFSAWDLQGEVASWVKLQLGLDSQTVSSVFVRSMEEKYRVVEVSVVREDLTEASLHVPILKKYAESFWPAVHTVRQDQGSPCMCLTVVQFLPTGHLLAYTDLDWQRGLAMLDQELQHSQTILLQSGARDLQIGHMITVAKSDLQFSTMPLYQFTMARAIILTLSEDTARLYLMDHGIEATSSVSRISSLPSSLKSLPPRLVLCRVQGITPTPSTKLVRQSIVTLSHLTNSATAVSLVIRPTLSTSKVLCQLISSQQGNLIIPALDILHVLASTQTSLKHLVISNRGFPCIAIDLIIPTIVAMFPACQETIGLRTVCTALETIHCLLVPLQADQLRLVFSDVNVSILSQVGKFHTLGQYQVVMDKILELDPGRKYKVPLQEKENSIVLAKTNIVPKITPNPVFKNTDIRERKPQQPYNPHRIVTTDKQIWSSADQMEQKHRRETVAGFINRGQVTGQMAPIVDPDMERRRQEREHLTADAMKLFNQQKGILSKKIDEKVKIKDTEVGSVVSENATLPTRSTLIPTTDASVNSFAAPPPKGVALPSWLKDDSSMSSSEDEGDVEGQGGLPPWLAKPAQRTAIAVPIDKIVESVAKLPFAGALESSLSSLDEDQTQLSRRSSNPPIPATTPSMPPTTSMPGARFSPEECGSGTESSKEVFSAKESRAKDAREQRRINDVTNNKMSEQEFNNNRLPIKHDEEVATDTAKEDQQQQILTRDFILSEKHSISVELWDAERKSELDNNRLAVLICGFLNSKAGGTIYAGVKRNGLVRGVPLERKDRDNMRQMLDRVLASMINPRVPPNVVDIDFVAVEDKSRPSCPYRLMVVMVKGQKDGLNKVYMAHNLTSRSTVEEGAYVRRGHGPSFNTKLGHEEMLKLVERR